MGFLDALGTLLTPTANAVGGYMQGRQQAQQQSFQDQLKMMQMQHQQAQDDQTRQINEARLKQYQTEDQLRQQKLQADQNAFLEGQREFPNDPDFQGAFTPGMSGITDLLRAKRTEKAATAKEQHANKAAYDVGHTAYPQDPTFAAAYNPDYAGYAGYGKDLASREGQDAMWDRQTRTLTQAYDLAEQRINKAGAGAGPKVIPMGVDPSTGQMGFIVNGVPSTWDGPTQSWKPAGGITRAQTAGQGGGGGALSQQDRQNMKEQLKFLGERMSNFEDATMAAGGLGYGTQLTAAAAQNKDQSLQGATERFFGNKLLGSVNAGYQTYKNDVDAFAKIVTNLQSRRFSEHQLEIEKDISGLAGGDLNQTIRNKRALRDIVLEEVNQSLNAPPAAPAAATTPRTTTPTTTTTGGTKLSPAQYQTLRKNHTDEEIRRAGYQVP